MYFTKTFSKIKVEKNPQAGDLMSLKAICFYFLAFPAFLVGADAITITVGPEGSDHVEIQAAIGAASPGDVVEVSGGTYRENLVVDVPITLRGAGNGTEKPIVDAGGRGSAVTLIADGVRLEGFILENGGFGRAGIEVRSDDNLIRGNLITDNNWYGIFLGGSSGSIIEENVIWNNKYGIWINAGSDDNQILSNVLEGNENYNAFDLGKNLWEGNFYGDFDVDLPIYEVPGISSVDRSPSGPEKETVLEEIPEAPENFTEPREETEGVELAAPTVEDSATGAEGVEDSGSMAPSFDDDLSLGESSANLTFEVLPSEEPPALRLTDLDLDLELNVSLEEDAVDLPAGPPVGDAIINADLGEADANESAQDPVVIQPPEATRAAVEARTAEDWVERGDHLSNLGRYSEALSFYDQALEMEPELFDAWDGKGDALMMTGSYDKALKCYERALVIDPDSAESWYHKGNTLQMLLRFDEALGCYNEALRIDPEFAEAWNKKGMILNRLGRYQEALASFDEALKIVPGYAAAWSNKSWAHQMLGEDDSAKEAFDRAKALG